MLRREFYRLVWWLGESLRMKENIWEKSVYVEYLNYGAEW